MLMKIPATIDLSGLQVGDEIRLVMPMGSKGAWGVTVQHAGENRVDRVTKTHVHVLVDGSYRARYSRATGRSSRGGVCVPVALCAEAKAFYDAGNRELLAGDTLFVGFGKY